MNVDDQELLDVEMDKVEALVRRFNRRLWILLRHELGQGDINAWS